MTKFSNLEKNFELSSERNLELNSTNGVNGVVEQNPSVTKTEFKRTGKLIGLVFVMAVALTITFSACGKDSGSNDNSNNPVADPEETIFVAMRNNAGTYVQPDGCDGTLHIDGSDNFSGGYNAFGRWKFVSMNKISGLGNITQIPASGWADKVAVIEGFGYVARYEGRNSVNSDFDRTTYVRIYVDSYIIASGTNGIIGAYVKYQSPFVP